MEQQYMYLWGNTDKRQHLKGQRCMVLARSSHERAVLLEFQDGEHVVSSAHAIRCIYEEEDTMSRYITETATRQQRAAASEELDLGLTVAELKDELKARGLPSSGSKQELEQRLAVADLEEAGL